MVKKTSIFSIVALLLALTGCDDKARQLAKQTDLVLKQRSKELAAKTAAEVNAYHAYASLVTEDQRTLLAQGLANDRSEQAERIAADYLYNKRVIPQWRTQLTQYADMNYAAERQQLITDLDATSLYLQKYEGISIEQDKVDALEKLLTALIKEPSLQDQVTSMSSFAKDTKDAFEKDVCTSLKTKKEGTDAAAKAANTLYSDKKCDQILK